MRGFALLLLCPLFVQDPPAEPAGPIAWKLGKTEFAKYNAATVSFDSGGEESVRGNPERLAGIFGYEISDKGIYRTASCDRAELPLLLGFSLPPKQLKPGQSHDWVLELDESFDHGPITAKCTAVRKPVEEINLVPCVKFEVTATLAKSTRPPVAIKPPRAVQKGSFEGTLYFDAARGVMRRLDFNYSITLAPADPKAAPETMALRERLELSDILAVRHKTFEADVNAAIDKGIGYLWRAFNKTEGRWGDHYDHTSGPTALALLAILKGSMDRKDERILKALDWMMGQPLKHTYDVGVSLMALEAFYSPSDMAARAGHAAATEKDIVSRLDPGHARWGQSAAKWLELNLGQAMWSYPSTDAGRRDFSNTQYGVLGLYSAARCGFSPDVTILRRVMESYLAVQQKKGPKVEVTLQDGEGPSKTMARVVAEARGWPYEPNPDDPCYGSMTVAGVSSLVILDALRRRAGDGKYDARDQARVRTAIRDGWAWLQQHWTVKGNPEHGHDWTYYWLYGLERAAMLDGVGRVGDHDWYGEGATFLVSNQVSDGTWRTQKWCNVYDNCFAILFLKRATVRVATGGK